jgi:hypothetical protein
LHCYVETCAVEGLEHDFGSVLTGFRRVERWLGEEEVVVFGFYAEVFEDGVLPETFHQVLVLALAYHIPSIALEHSYPVLNLAMSYRIVDIVSCNDHQLLQAPMLYWNSSYPAQQFVPVLHPQ